MANVFYNLAAELGLDEETLEELNEAVASWSKKSEIKRGDILCLDTEEDRYRNDNCYIWDGEKAIELDDVDEYGNVPPQFQITDTEFDPHYWVSAVAHNGIFWLAPEIRQRMKFTKSENGVISSSVRIGDKTWTCIVDYPRGVPRRFLDDLAMRVGKNSDNNGHVFVFTVDQSEYEGKVDYDSTFFLSSNFNPRNYETDVVE